MNKSKEEWRLKLASLLQDGDISVKHPRIEKKIWDCVQDAIESEAVKRENFAFNKGRTTHSQNREAGYKEIFAWLLGENGDFPDLSQKPHYSFRTELRKRLSALTTHSQNREAELLHDFAMFAHTNYYNGTDGSEYAYSQEVVYMVDSFLESFTPHHQELEDKQ